MLHPVGPEPRAVYLRRRVAVVGAVVVVLIAVIWISTSSASGSADPQPAQAAATAPPTTTAPTATEPTATEPAATEPTSSPAPPSSGASSTSPNGPAAGGPTQMAPPANGPQLAACSDNALKVQAQVAAPSYPTGAQPVFRLLVTNTGGSACTTDLSPKLQQFVVYTADGQTRIWSNNDCFPGQGADTRTLAPADQAVFSIQWAGTTSAAGCTSTRVPAPPGQYVVLAVLGGHQSDPVGFTVTAA